jgi:hypothetical protein
MVRGPQRHPERPRRRHGGDFRRLQYDDQYDDIYDAYDEDYNDEESEYPYTDSIHGDVGQVDDEATEPWY